MKIFTSNNTASSSASMLYDLSKFGSPCIFLIALRKILKGSLLAFTFSFSQVSF